MTHKWDKEIRAFLDGKEVEGRLISLNPPAWIVQDDLTNFDSDKGWPGDKTVRIAAYINMPVHACPEFLYTDEALAKSEGWPGDKTVRIEWEE